MKILNLIWGFSLGAGIDKCFLTYARLGEVDKEVEVKSVCINLLNLNSHIEPLEEIGATFINIKGKSDLSWLSKLNALITVEQPDIVFTHGFNGAIMMLLEKWLKGMKTPFVCSYHGAYHAPTKSKKILEPVYNGLPLFIYKYIAKKIVCVESVSREYLWGKGVKKEKVVTVHNGIMDIPAATPVILPNGNQDDAPTIITASRITEVKGLPYLLNALKILKNKGVRFHYYMLGEGPDLNSLKGQAKDLDICDMVSFVGFQSNIPEWLAACDIFALPSLYEYHSIAVLEAMRSSKAIVATTVGGNGESITDGIEGIMIPPRDEQALANALEKLLTSAALRKQYGENARKRFEQEFTEEAMMRNLVRVLKS